MAQERPNRLVEWIVLVREQWPILRDKGRDWTHACREEPALIWATPAVRYIVYLVGGFLTIWLMTTTVRLITPPLPESAKEQASAADYHVICTDPDCGHHFVIHREFGFSGFPIECPKCKRETGESAQRCHSTQCRGRWTTPKMRDGRRICSDCDRELN